MPVYRVYATTVGSKYVGEVEADSIEQAEDLAWDHENIYCSLCHQCTSECEDIHVEELHIEEVEQDNIEDTNED